MKILYVAYQDMSEQTGLVRHITELSHQLRCLGHKVILCVPGIGRYNGRLSLDIRPVPVLRVKMLQALSYHLSFPWTLYRLIRKEKPDVLYANTIPFSLVPWIMAKLCRIPYIVEVSGWIGEESLAHRHWPAWLCRLAQGVQNRNVRGARGVVTISLGLLQALASKCERALLMEMAADTDRFRPQEKHACRARKGLPENKKIVGYVGGFFPWHGTSRIVEAAALLSRRDPNVLFVLVGDGETKRRSQERARALGVEAQILFPGAVPLDESPDWMACFDVGVILFEPVRKDPGSPIKLFEYMASGVPVVASGVEGYGNVLLRHECGVSLADETPETLAQALETLLNEPDRRAAMGKRGREAAIRLHSWPINAKNLSRFLQEKAL